ncbi:MAG: tetratricopeptide repeat protein [Desulfomonile tiedjei]|uniref:Tetratricopeptide repeat protein n=1 Tax=Desulfomonile tiedjei TaxID=2358 RepID=A0A9D6UY20_9BACT|nr:tetratricopeptide repeat protein [Desulfomonile tiedjei]
MSKSRTLFSWLALFGAGFLAGVVFSAWKLDTATAPGTKQLAGPAETQNPQMDLKTRIAGLEKMLAARPNDADVLIQLGNDYFDSGSHDKALEYYQKALEVDPRNPDVITDMGISYRKLGKSQESADAFRRALSVDPNHPMALFNLGIVLRDDLKDPEGALKAWETFLANAGDSPHAVMVRPWVNLLKEKEHPLGRK